MATGLLSTVDESDFSGLSYHPKTRETKGVFEVVLSFVQTYIGEQPRDILLGAADEVLKGVKQNAPKKERLAEVKELLGDVSEDRFATLENLVNKLTDYGTIDDKTEDAIDETYGVAVVFDEDEDKDGQLHEVQVNK